MLRKIFLDKRGTVTGKDSHINLHNFIDLNAHIINVVTTNMSLPFTYSNGLTLTGSNVTFGGDLTTNTIIDGDNTYNLSFIDLDGFNVSAQAVDITASTNLFINAPNTSSADNDWVLTLIDDTTGEAEWKILPINNADNGLHVDNNTVYLGGTLLENTIVDGDATNSLTFENLVDFEAIAEGVAIRGTASIFIQTPDQIALTATDGQVLTLIDSTTGEAEWQDVIATVEVVNGLYDDAGTAKLGGLLVEDTTIDGDVGSIYALQFINLKNFQVYSNEGVTINDSVYVSLQCGTNYVETNQNGLFIQNASVATNIRTINNLVFTPVGTQDHTILADPTAAGGTLNLQLPLLSTLNYGTTYVFKLISAGTMDIIAQVGEPIFDNTDQLNISTSVVGETIRIQCDTLKWYVL